MLTDPARLTYDGARPHAFCANAKCDVVYFASPHVYSKSDVRVRVGLKETAPPIPVCYCFAFTEEMIRTELKRENATTIPDRIRSEIKAGNCACEIKNPQGRCCLGEVNAAVARLRKEVAGGPSVSERGGRV